MLVAVTLVIARAHGFQFDNALRPGFELGYQRMPNLDALPKFMQDAYRTMCGGNRSCQPKNCLKESDCAKGVCLTIADYDVHPIGGVCSKGLMPDGTLCLDDSWCISGKCSRISPWSA